MTTADLVFEILRDNPETRNSNKLLYWTVVDKMGLTQEGTISFMDWMLAPSFHGVIRRAQDLRHQHRIEIAKGERRLTNSFLNKSEIREIEEKQNKPTNMISTLIKKIWLRKPKNV